MLAGWGRFAGLWVGAGVFLGLLLRLLSRLDEGHLLERVWAGEESTELNLWPAGYV